MPRSTERVTRALAEIECRRRGWDFENTSWTERFINKGRVTTRTKDLLGFVDALAFPADGGTVAIQYTSATNVGARVAKIRQHKNFPRVMRAGWQVVVWGFDTKTGLLQRELVAETPKKPG